MSDRSVKLYERLPEIYRIRDSELAQYGRSGPLESYLRLAEYAFSAIHDNIEELYDNLFIETCDDWVVPYIGDSLGTSHLKGDPWNTRADVADTIALRRRKGTLGAIELLTYDLTEWGVHCVEMRENLAWCQHLNHRRPDDETGGTGMYTVPRGGMATLRDPAMLSLIDKPYDPYAHVADLKPPAGNQLRYNLPDLAIFLWRLKAYHIALTRPVKRGVVANHAPGPGEAKNIVCFDIHPLGEPVRLFNMGPDVWNETQAPEQINDLTGVDEVPGPIEVARLTAGSEAGNWQMYVSVRTDDSPDTGAALQIVLPSADFSQSIGTWKTRGASLCGWKSLYPPLKNHEVAIDPVIGRIALGVDDHEADALNALMVGYTYGAVGPVGTHPIPRSPAPASWNDERVELRLADISSDHDLSKALGALQNAGQPIVIEISDSMVYDVSQPDITLKKSLIIRAADGHRPIIRLARPLRFKKAAGASDVTVHLEGLYLTYGSVTANDDPKLTQPLISMAAVDQVEIIGCTLDPGGFNMLKGGRAPIKTAMRLENVAGINPDITIDHSITGPLFIDTDYDLSLAYTIVDAGSGVNSKQASFALSGNPDKPESTWGPRTTAEWVTVFGRMRVQGLSGKGGIWVHALEVLDNQKGCIRNSYVSGHGDRLPQNYPPIRGSDGTRLLFNGEAFGDMAYGQLSTDADFKVRERGPGDDMMGAFGLTMESHKWRNLTIRYREFMPVGVRLLIIPIT